MKDKSSLLVHGLSDQHKDFLYEYAQKELGSRSRTKAIIALIDKEMGKETDKIDRPAPPPNASKTKKKRLQISLRETEFNLLEEFTRQNDTSMQFYVISLILKDIYNKETLLGNEIEELRKSNYMLYKIGVNLNQITKAINAGERKSVPPTEKLAKEITKHTDIVAKILRDNIEKY